MTAIHTPTTDLTTGYLGLRLAHPVVASSSPATETIDRLCALEEAGVAAVVLPSLFEEDVEGAAWLDPFAAGDTHPEVHGGYLPDLVLDASGVDAHIDRLRRAKAELTVPVFASLNGTTPGGWVHYARALADEGADAIELNVYDVPADVTASAEDVEDRVLQLVSAVRSEIDLGLAVKIGPFFSSPGHMVRRLGDAGADAVVVFNRFYQPDLDLGSLAVRPDIQLSTAHDLRLVLRWIAILHGRVPVQLAATGGIGDAEAVVKLVLAGADVTMMAAALLREGPEAVTRAVDGLRRWFDDRGYDSLDQARGSVSQLSVPDPTAFERANYVEALHRARR